MTIFYAVLAVMAFLVLCGINKNVKRIADALKPDPSGFISKQDFIKTMAVAAAKGKQHERKN